MGFDQEQFNQFIIDNNVVGFFKEPVTLKSGRKSHWYVNWRNVAEDVFLIDKLSDYVLDFAFLYLFFSVLDKVCFYGVPEGATKLGIITQYKFTKMGNIYPGSHALAMGRGKTKKHGEPKDRYFLGLPREETIILEDVTTTGSSLLETIANLKEAQVPIRATIGLTNRLELIPIPGKDKKDVVEKFAKIFKRAASEDYLEPMAVEKAMSKVEMMGSNFFKTIKIDPHNYYSMSNAKDLLPLAYEKLKPGKEIVRAIEKEFQEYGVEKLKLL